MKKRSETKLKGRFGEATALDYLKRNGYRPVAMGYYCRFGEIDVIVSNDSYVVFVEVKLRKSDDFAVAREFVDVRKQEKLRAAASMWLSENETELQPRFDVIEIYAPQGYESKEIKINHIENAF